MSDDITPDQTPPVTDEAEVDLDGNWYPPPYPASGAVPVDHPIFEIQPPVVCFACEQPFKAGDQVASILTDVPVNFLGIELTTVQPGVGHFKCIDDVKDKITEIDPNEVLDAGNVGPTFGEGPVLKV